MREIRLFCVLGLVFGALLSYVALTTVCMCPAQIVGQPSSCSCAQSASQGLSAGIGFILVSAIALGLSFIIKPKTTKTGIERAPPNGRNRTERLAQIL